MTKVPYWPVMLTGLLDGVSALPPASLTD